MSGLLDRMRHSAFQGRKLGEAFEAWQRMIDGDGLICLGLAGSLASAGLGPLVAWLVERGYVDLVASTSANVTEDLLELRGARFFQVDPEHVDDAELWRRGFYRFYDHVVSAADYDAMEDFTRGFFESLAKHWPRAVDHRRALHARVRRLARRARASAARSRRRASATACRCSCRPRPTGRWPRAIGRRRAQGPGGGLLRATTRSRSRSWARYMPPGPGTSAIFLGGGVPKDFIQITATSV